MIDRTATESLCAPILPHSIYLALNIPIHSIAFFHLLLQDQA